MKTLLTDITKLSELNTSRRNILHGAAESGDAELLGYLFQEQNSFFMSNVNINQQDLWGETPLIIAATRSAKSVLHLIEHKATMDITQEDHQTALHFACQATDDEMIHIVDILKERCSTLIKMKDDGGRTPIFKFMRLSGCIKLLLDRGADFNVRDHKNRSLVHEACSRGYPETLAMILARCERRLVTRKDDDGITPLGAAFACCTTDSARCAAMILECPNVIIDPKADKKGRTKCWTPIHHAAKLGDVKFLNLVLKKFGISELVGNTEETLEQIASGGPGRWEGEFKVLLEDFARKAQLLAIRKAQKVSKGEIYENYAMLLR